MAHHLKWQAPGGYVWVGDTLVPSTVELQATGDLGEPNVYARFEIRDGVPEVVDYRVTTSEKGRGIKSADLRTLGNVEVMMSNAFHMFAKLRAVDPETGETLGATMPKSEREWWATDNAVEGARAQGRGPSDAELERVAEVYRGAAEDGEPTKAVAFFLGVSRATASRRVRLARDKGLIPEPGEQGD